MAWDPTRDLLTMQERLESLFGRATPGWVPPADLAEFDDRYVLSIEVPAVRREDIHIDATERTVLIRGHRPPESCCPDRYQQLERGYGSFSRLLTFSHRIVTADIVAELVDGVLTLVVPKLEARRQIEVE